MTLFLSVDRLCSIHVHYHSSPGAARGRYVRGLPAVKKIWAAAHRTEDLLVSFDGASL
jgi:hypothetical protein